MTPKNYAHPRRNLYRFASSEPSEYLTPFGRQLESNYNIIGDYSLGEGKYALKVPESISFPDISGNIESYNDIYYELHRALIRITDNTANSDYEYVSNNPLDIGIDAILNGKYGQAYATPEPIKTYAGWGSYSGENVKALDNGNNTGRSWVITWDIDRLGGPVWLRGSQSVINGLNGVDFGEEIIISVKDDMSTLLKHTILFQGIIHFGNK